MREEERKKVDLTIAEECIVSMIKSSYLHSLLASVPGLPRSVRVLIVRRRQTFENRGRPGRITWVDQGRRNAGGHVGGVHIIIM